MKSPRILLWDAEVTPNVSFTWGGKYQVDVIQFVQPWYLLSVAYKWLGDDKVHCLSLPQFKSYKKDKRDDKELCRAVWELMDKSDIMCAHNGDGYDQKMLYARFVKHGFPPPAPSQTIDTLRVARKHFKFSSNRLNDLGIYLDVGKKMPHHGFDTWLGCMDGDRRAWREMVEYNKQDVLLLEQVYQKLKPYMTYHPNANLYNDTTGNCPVCGSDKLIRNGWRYSLAGKTQRYQCTSCGRWSAASKAKMAVVR